MKHNESTIQQQIIEWCEWNKGKYPCLAFIHHSPNGGKRNIREAARFKKEGVKAGFPDLFLPYTSNKYSGLFVEVKTEKGRMSESQKKWEKHLGEAGYKFVVCRSLDDFIKVIKEYLN